MLYYFVLILIKQFKSFLKKKYSLFSYFLNRFPYKFFFFSFISDPSYYFNPLQIVKKKRKKI